MAPAVTFNETLWLAIAEPSRRKLIDVLLTKGETTASKLAGEVPFSRQAVTKHMAVLKKAGLIRARHTGREVLFAVRPEGITGAAREMAQAAALWDTRLQKIKHIAETIQRESTR